LIEPREEKAEPFLIRTQNLQRRLQRLLGSVDPASSALKPERICARHPFIA